MNRFILPLAFLALTTPAFAEGPQDTVDALVMWGRGGGTTLPARYIFTVVDGKVDSWRMTGRLGPRDAPVPPPGACSGGGGADRPAR